MKVLDLFLAAILIFTFIHYTEQCTLPAALRGLWISSEKDQLEFADSSFSGFKVHVYNTDNFTCIDTSGNNYLFQSEQFRRFGLWFYAYMCIEFEEIKTGELYKYYKKSPEEPDANNERVFFRLTTFATATVSDVCTVTDTTSIRYSMLMKNGSEENVASRCPIPFLGKFSYSFDTGSGNLCPNSSELDVCSNKKTMTFDYTKCNQIQAYSAGGVVKCIYSSKRAGLTTLHVYNLDASTDQSSTYSFTCYQVKGYSKVKATQYPGDCPSDMNHTYVASPGATMVLRSNQLCAYAATTTTLSAGAIAAIVIVLFLIIVAIIAALIIYFYRKKKKQRQAEWEALNRKVDPDELSPNMRLGLPDESRYDLDRLMYSPENMKNGLIKRSQRKDMVGLEGLEGYNEGEKYMDEDQRQTALEAQMFAEKRKRKDNKDEFRAADATNKVFSDRIKDLAKGRKRPIKMMALAKLRLRPRARPMADATDAHDDGRSSKATKTKDIVIQVEEAEGETTKRKTRFADEQVGKNGAKNKEEAVKIKPLEQVETLSDIADNENAVDDLSDDDIKEPRLILPKLRPDKKDKRKRPKDRFSLGKDQQTSGMPHNTRFMPPKAKRVQEDDMTEPMPLTRTNPNHAKLAPLARIHRKDNPRAWKEAFGDNVNGMESMDLETLKRRLPENRWKKLLEELYRDKKYFDYVKKSTTNTEKDLFSSADESLQYLYGRALFWEEKEPIPTRPTSQVKRMFSRYEPSKSGKSVQRSATSGVHSGHKRPTRTPSTQVGRLRKREALDKKKKDDLNNNRKNSKAVPSFFEGGTQTDFSPMPPLTPVSITDEANMGAENLSFGQSPEEDRYDTPVIPYMKEVTRSDIKLEEFHMDEMEEEEQEGDMEDDYNTMFNRNDPNYQQQTNTMSEDVTAAV